ncbi:MAG: pilus assembly protein [Sphingomonadales bacterium]|nr:pilus assembly protein [Sphingomonadales bacterium]
MSARLNFFGNRVARGVRQLRRDRRGATLVEFSLIAFPSLILLLGTFEIGFVYWANQELENATRDAARLVRTARRRRAISIRLNSRARCAAARQFLSGADRDSDWTSAVRRPSMPLHHLSPTTAAAD